MVEARRNTTIPDPIDPPFPVFIGTCIYCGATDGLTDEHVVPYSLGGTWILEKATCPRCQKLTSQLERHISREHFIALRTAADFPTYHPKGRPSRIPQKIGRVDGSHILELPPDEHPAPIVLIRFAVPTFFTRGPVPSLPQAVGARVFARTAKVEQLKDHGAQRFGVPLPDRIIYARFLAKVGLTFAVGCVGLDSFQDVFVQKAILGESEDVAHWVGCVDSESFTTGTTQGGLHELVAIKQGTLIQVAVRLFSSLDSPEYRIVVGVLRPEDAA